MKKYLLLLLATAGLRAQAQGSLNSGLLGRFPFDNSLTDATGNIGNVSSANVAYGPDARSQANAALRLVGTGEAIIEPSGLLSFGTTGSFSFTAAFRTLSSGTQSFFSDQGTYSTTDATSSRGWSLGFDGSQVGKVYLNLVAANSANGNLGLATQASYNDGLWHTAAAVVNRSTRQIRLYVDGVAQPLTYVSSRPDYGTISGTTFTLATTPAMFVDLSPGYSRSVSGSTGAYSRFGVGFNGWLDEARFYNRVLTDAEVQTLSGQVLATLAAQATAARVQVFPSPAAAGAPLAVQLPQPVAASQLRVLDVLGRAVPVGVVAQPGGAGYELRGLPAGLYLLQVSLPEGLVVRRFQVQ